MAEQRKYLKEWRDYRKMTQAQVLDRLAVLEDEKLPRTGASLSRLENGKQPYSERILEALAEIYETEAWCLIGKNPFKEGRVLDLVGKLTEDQQDTAFAVLEAMQKTGGK